MDYTLQSDEYYETNFERLDVGRLFVFKCGSVACMKVEVHVGDSAVTFAISLVDGRSVSIDPSQPVVPLDVIKGLVFKRQSDVPF